MNIKTTSMNASKELYEPLLTRRERAIQAAIASGQNVEAVIKRENAIEQAELEFMQRQLNREI